jgi:hypothetical protein
MALWNRRPSDHPAIARALAVPLAKLQTQILRLVAAHRNPESYVAGASALNQDGCGGGSRTMGVAPTTTRAARSKSDLPPSAPASRSNQIFLAH